MFGNRLIMRRKPVDNSISHGLFGSHEGAPAKRNDVAAELVATIGRPVMRSQRLLAELWPRNRSSITETGAILTPLFGFQFRLNARVEAVAHESITLQ
jgi:hypothetical protein